MAVPLLASCLLLVAGSGASDDRECKFVSPPRGWNSYQSQVGITGGNGGQGEGIAIESAEFVAKHLLHVGYEYIVLDAGWFGDNGGASMTVDAHGRLMPNTTLHPSSAGGKGFAPLASKVCSHRIVRFSVQLFPTLEGAGLLESV